MGKSLHKSSYILFHETGTPYEQWFRLGAFDPTRQSEEHERDLVRYLLTIGATLGLVMDEGLPRYRCLFCPVDRKSGIYSIGFMASDTPEFFAGPRPAFEALLRAFGDKHAARKLVGPINGLTWFNYRLRVDDDHRAYPWEPVRQPQLQKFLEAHQFESDAHYTSICTRGLQKFMSETAADLAKVTGNGITITRAYPDQMTPAQFREIHELSLAGFAGNYLFSPISFEAFASLYLAGKSDKPSCLLLATNDKQKIIAYALGFIEDNQLVYKTVTTDPAWRKQGISNALFHGIAKEIAAGLADCYISALVFKGLASESYARHGETIWEHQYILLSRTMSGG
ncbi:GNAT family N-acetyltransferase [Oligoflexus tunisiensis]|uniref:GNAT family N-acetyltransferase n=1 Tax=Oligoflexus tunisiensis TaxID=708132 RepID=UPI00114C8E97|nr:GNAT family N-acetyltransferase [Oligoflexus tunisiensis]